MYGGSRVKSTCFEKSCTTNRVNGRTLQRSVRACRPVASPLCSSNWELQKASSHIRRGILTDGSPMPEIQALYCKVSPSFGGQISTGTGTSSARSMQAGIFCGQKAMLLNAQHTLTMATDATRSCHERSRTWKMRKML
eukprot:2020609-Rhodomonas_salina.1